MASQFTPKRDWRIGIVMDGLVIIGGGTFNPIRNHLSLAAPAFGTIAKRLREILGGTLILTKMADQMSNIICNKDLSNYVDTLIADSAVKTIIFSAAVCDYNGSIGSIPSNWRALRLQTSDGSITAKLTPADKIISRIRIERPDIFLVGFKTTTVENDQAQFLSALRMMKATRCNLVLANDTLTRLNMIITPEESAYHITHNRNEAINGLAEMIRLRSNLTYHRTNFITCASWSTRILPKTFQEILQFLIDNGGFIENNGNGFTPGHFCRKIRDNSFLSSQRRADHNKVFEEGMTFVTVIDGQFKALGERKPSVGAQSQWLMFNEHPDYDCIIHTHNPLKEGSKVPVVEQKPYQCGSLECGINTVNNLKDFDGIKAVFLNKHGINILFKSTNDSKKIINFIKENVVLGVKIGL